MRSVEIKKVIMQHTNYASAVMNTNYETRENTIASYKNFIDTNSIISSIISPIKEAAADAPDLFNKNGYDISVCSDTDDIKDKAILYKHLSFMAESNKNLAHYAISIYWRERKFNSAIQKLLQASVLPLINYIRLKLEELYAESEDQEKQEQSTSIHNGDNIYGCNFQKVENGQAAMNNVGNDNSKKNFTFQKESFFLGVLSAIISGLILFGIEELIKYLISIFS